ncbi:C40 family peptidase [Alicyclobacillus mali]|uniref:C40 family peptidase n=1 Tax=Alicyclobacillus mali (ex Roth et al. 2021) TaxID=1123961 RepID=A0ABS0F500_9BACL|nr:LysM peptidoglycan-binding domain-containing protein [Alicyclobacillus mali (ex Roth et al. 2021)]MBF8378338.1 C40 family peptidase [Alicyclobacillus mali (ex Roth et al. 2021)]MCL6488310.1 C40 family peptidase [Alicyclobacillus mali (ex Roth et al. 2021)]
MRSRIAASVGWLAACIGISFVPATALASSATYTVRPGDSLYGIAAKFHVTVHQLELWNHLSSNVIHPGQVLVVSQGGSHSVTSSSPSSSRTNASTYVVQPGDSLWSIGQKFHITLSQLEAWNGLHASSAIHPGESLKVSPPKHPTISGAAKPVTLSSRGSSPDATNTSLAQSALGFAVADYARTFLGAPYEWGASGPSAFDCSGLIQYVYAHFYIQLPRTSYQQYDAGIPVSEGDLEPGDIVFFDTYGDGPSHDGIYLGGGQFINAASTNVEIDSLSDSYWANHYIGARRVIGQNG